MELVAIGFRFFLGAVFVLAGLAKLARRSDFTAAVRGYELVPTPFVPLAAGGIPLLETALGVSLLLGLVTQVASVLAAGSLAVFSVAVGINLIRGRGVDCGCFALGGSRHITWSLIARNVIFVVMAVVTFAFAPRLFALDELYWGGARSIPRSDGVALLVAGTGSALMLTLITELVQLLRLRRSFTERKR